MVSAIIVADRAVQQIVSLLAQSISLCKACYCSLPWSRWRTLLSELFQGHSERALSPIGSGGLGSYFSRRLWAGISSWSHFTLHLQSYFEFFRSYAVQWVPDFLHSQHDQESSSDPPQDVWPSLAPHPALSSSCLMCPSFSWPAGEALAVRSRSGSLATLTAAASPCDCCPIRKYRCLQFRQCPSVDCADAQSPRIGCQWSVVTVGITLALCKSGQTL